MAKKLVDMAKEDQNWKVYIKSEDESGYIWKNHWGWLVDEYKELKRKLDEKTEQSAFLSGVRVEVKEDPRSLGRVPESVNHDYGWVAGNSEFRLQKYGPDTFKGLPLPDLFNVTK